MRLVKLNNIKSDGHDMHCQTGPKLY